MYIIYFISCLWILSDMHYVETTMQWSLKPWLKFGWFIGTCNCLFWELNIFYLILNWFGITSCKPLSLLLMFSTIICLVCRCNTVSYVTGVIAIQYNMKHCISNGFVGCIIQRAFQLSNIFLSQLASFSKLHTFITPRFNTFSLPNH